jgi:tRNA (cytidine/uridine-2'-O-)-methyltransferase
MHIVLLEPEIPPNTGNVARLCAATRSTLHLVEPFGFKLDDAALKRAGMDYWQHVEWHRWKNWSEFEASVASAILADVEPGILPGGKTVDSTAASGKSNVSHAALPNPGGRMPPSTSGRRPDATPPRLWFIEQGGARFYTEAKFGPDDYLVFGRETAGLPKTLLDANAATWLRIPMFNPDARSLNLSNCVALVLFEALRQQGFPGGE